MFFSDTNRKQSFIACIDKTFQGDAWSVERILRKSVPVLQLWDNIFNVVLLGFPN